MKINPVLVVAVAALIAPTLHGQEQKTPTVNELVQKNIEAKGGANALKSLQSIKLTGKLLVNQGQLECAQVASVHQAHRQTAGEPGPARIRVFPDEKKSGRGAH